MRCRGYNCKRQRPWIPDQVRDDRRRKGFAGLLAGFRPRTPRSFCFGKRTQNHGRPGVALRGPLPRSRRLGLRNSLRSDSPRHQQISGLRRSHARRRHVRWRHGMARVGMQNKKREATVEDRGR